MANSCLSVRKTDSETIIEKLKMQFSRLVLPEIVISDNGSQYASTEFERFASGWHFQHINSSRLHSQSNGKVESAVKICKGIMKKQCVDILIHISHYWSIVIPPRKLVYHLHKGCSAGGHAICYLCHANN